MNIWISAQDSLYADALYTYLKNDFDSVSVHAIMDVFFSDKEKRMLVNPRPDMWIWECSYEFWKTYQDVFHKLVLEVSGTTILLITPDLRVRFINELLEIGIRGIYYKKNELVKVKDAIEALNKGDAYLTPAVATLILNKLYTKKIPKFLVCLSDREYEILVELANGNSYKLIADSLNITIHTVRFHVKSLYRKLKVQSKGEAIKKYYQGLFETDS